MQLLDSVYLENRQKRRWRKAAILGSIVVVGLVGWKAAEYAAPRYRLWKQARALEQAKGYIEKHDAANAQLALEVALKTVPGNPETLRVAAEMLEQVGAPQAMKLRRAIVQVEPDSAEDVEALVLSCLRFRDFNAAKDALSSTPAAVAAKPAALRGALAFALATDNAPVADLLFKQLETAVSADDRPALKQAHALLYLRHPNAERRQEAQRQLEQLAHANPRGAAQIYRELAGAALREKDYSAAHRWLDATLADASATFTDRLQKANLALLIDKQPFEPVFASLAPFAARNDADAAAFVQWLLVQSRAGEAETWLATLPVNVRDSAPLKSVEADAVAQLQDWDRLAVLLGDGAWGPISKDTLRLAFAAHTVDNPSRPGLRHDTWELTLNSGSLNISTLRILQRLSALWKWDEESERTLWATARAFPDQTWAHQALFNLYRQKKNTTGMRDVMTVLRDSDGAVPRYQHDWALLTLLVEPTSTWNPAKDTMRKLYEQDPTNATYGTGYAFALAQAGKGPEAAAVIDRMKPTERDYPPRQPYLAFAYGVAKRRSDLEHAVSLSEGVPYLPEESYLFTRAHDELERRVTPVKPKPDAVTATKS